MTEEIIIDGVDVAKCRYFTSEWDFNNCGHICKGTECKYKRLWYNNKILYNEKVQLLDRNQELQDKLLKLNDLAHEVLLYELQTLDIDLDEYETHVRDTEFSPIVTRCTEMIDLIGYSDKCNKEV